MDAPASPLPDRHRQSFGDAREAAEFALMLERFEKGEIGADDYRQYRLSRGVYGQRQDGVHMVRAKVPAGVLSAAQLRVLADCATSFSRGYGHVTTRQNFQFHFVKPADLPPFLAALAGCGLTTREACSHTVRNVVACAEAGVCAKADVDVTGYAEAIARHFLRGPLGSGLPRKFKINLSGCAADCARGAMQDIGVLAHVREGRRVFRVLAGGGTATFARAAVVLEEHLPPEQLLAACEAVLRVFNAEGDRGNLQKARLKWVVHRLGPEAFRAAYRRELEAVLAAGGRPFAVDDADEEPPRHPRHAPAADPLPARFLAWRDAQVREQRQTGFLSATVFLRLGDISASQLGAVADLCERHGDGTARTTVGQNLLLRWVADEQLYPLWLGLDAHGLGEAHAERVSDVTSCPGAETCRIAVTASRGVAQLVGDHLRQIDADSGAAAQADIKVSGCPNGCGQHHVATIGLQGAVRKVGGKLAPQYQLSIGGGVDERGAVFGRVVARVPVRRVPQAIDRLLDHYAATRHADESPRAFFQRLDPAAAARLIEDLTVLTEENAAPEDFVDVGSSVAFQVVTLDGECSQ
ncbi:MAG: nitrite/sulfite reductase [Deltaproteobacteria bacterium]|nr:nitrite/sulfite reductase [Deltaproteobacteria bacterium]